MFAQCLLQRRAAATGAGVLNQILLRCLLLAMLLAITVASQAVGTFISAPNRIDMVHDSSRNIIYITNAERVLRYDLTSQAFLTPYTLGGNLHGIDISPDGNIIAVADKSLIGGCGVYLVDLNTGASNKITYAQEETGPTSVAYGNDGSLLINTGAQWGKLRRYVPGSGIAEIASSFRHRSMLSASADGNIIAMAEGNISSGAVGRYRISDGNLIRHTSYAGGTNAFNFEVGVNRDGTQIAVPTYRGTIIYNGDMILTGQVIGTYAGPQPIGVAYSPVKDIVYFPWAKTNNVHAYDTNTFELLAVYDFENHFDHTGNHPYTEGRMKISDDGRLLFATVAGGVRYVRISEAPMAEPQDVTVEEDSSIEITLTATDADDDPRTYFVEVQPEHGTLSGTAPNLVYTPDMDYEGLDSFTFKASDGDMVSTAATVNIIVTGVPDAPWAQDQTVLLNEDTSATIILTATDAEGDELSYSITSQPEHGTLEGDSQTVIYTPHHNFNGTDSFTFMVNDGALNSAPATVTINVAPVPDPPVAHDATIATNENTPVDFTLTGSDPDGNELSFTLVSLPAHGTLDDSDLPNLTYTPDLRYTGADSLTFIATDGFLESSTATVNIIISNLPDRPVANPATASTMEDTPVAIELTGTDLDGDPLTFAITVAPQHGVLSGHAPSVVYTPNPDYHGADAFQFTVSDGEHVSEPASVQILVHPVNDPPVATSLQVVCIRNQSVTFTLAGTDTESDVLRYLIADLPDHGQISGNIPEITYTPAKKYVGRDYLQFRIEDGENAVMATVEFVVIPKNKDIYAFDQRQVVPAGTGFPLTLTGWSAVKGPLNFNVLKAPKKGTISGIAPNLVYTPAPGFTGSDIIKFQVEQNGRTSKPGKIKLQVVGN